jgi:hypothetical protein
MAAVEAELDPARMGSFGRVPPRPTSLSVDASNAAPYSVGTTRQRSIASITSPPRSSGSSGDGSAWIDSPSGLALTEIHSQAFAQSLFHEWTEKKRETLLT